MLRAKCRQAREPSATSHDTIWTDGPTVLLPFKPTNAHTKRASHTPGSVRTTSSNPAQIQGVLELPGDARRKL